MSYRGSLFSSSNLASVALPERKFELFPVSIALVFRNKGLREIKKDVLVH